MAGINNSRSPRIMMYSQDGFGLGHMRRTTSIARQILNTRPDACVLTVADSRLGLFFDPMPHQGRARVERGLGPVEALGGDNDGVGAA